MWLRRKICFKAFDTPLSDGPEKQSGGKVLEKNLRRNPFTKEETAIWHK
jgi:hypothetical protein